MRPHRIQQPGRSPRPPERYLRIPVSQEILSLLGNFVLEFPPRIYHTLKRGAEYQERRDCAV